MLEDLATLFGSVESGNTSEWFFVVPVAAAAQLATTPALTNAMAFPDMSPKGGRIGSIPDLVSDQLDDEAILVDASQIAAAAEGLSVDVVTHATVDLFLGTGESPEQPLVSLWQRTCAAFAQSGGGTSPF